MLNSLSLCLALSLVGQAVDLTPNTIALRREGVQSDFPALAVDARSTPWVAYVEWDGKQDRLCLAKQTAGELKEVLTIGRPGIIHQPAIAADGSGAIIVVWSQVNEKNLMELKGQRVLDGKMVGDEQTLASSPQGGNALARAATDRQGRVWIVWQSMRGKLSDVFCRVFDPSKNQWTAETQVTRDPAGEWEPCLAFDARDGAWVIYDGSRGNEFNLYANRVALDGTVGETKTLIQTERYEGRASAIGTPDGKGIWLTCERGNPQWGLDSRAHVGQSGLNGRKNSVLAYWDLASDRVEEMPSPDQLWAALPGPPPTPINRPLVPIKRKQRPRQKSGKKNELPRLKRPTITNQGQELSLR